MSLMCDFSNDRIIEVLYDSMAQEVEKGAKAREEHQQPQYPDRWKHNRFLSIFRLIEIQYKKQ